MKTAARYLPLVLAVALSATPGAQKTPERGAVLDRVPQTPDVKARHVIYLHGRIIEEQGRRPTHPTWGTYEYQQILDRLAAEGLSVLSEQRPPMTDMDAFADHVADQVRALLRAGVPPERVSVVGFSKGGGIAMRASALLKNPRINFVFLAACGDGDFSGSKIEVWGRILSVYETSDEVGRSCQGLFAKSGATGARSEIRINLGEEHGAFFRPHREWLAPVLTWVAGGASQVAPASILSRVDHLVYATPELQRGIDRIEQLFGLRATPGGQHPARGTRNALVALGPTSYLEIIGPDPEQPTPALPRPFGIDGLKEPRLVTWAVKGTDLDSLARDAVRKGVKLGEVIAGSRRRADGVLLTWRYTDPRTVVADGVVPFVIDWGGTPHPARTATAGASLIELRTEHPDPPPVQDLLKQLGLEIRVQRGPRAGLIATVDSPRGRVELR